MSDEMNKREFTYGTKTELRVIQSAAEAAGASVKNTPARSNISGLSDVVVTFPGRSDTEAIASERMFQQALDAGTGDIDYREQAELWKSVAKAFDDLLAQIRETAQGAIDNTPYEAQYALQKIVRLIGEPSRP